MKVTIEFIIWNLSWRRRREFMNVYEVVVAAQTANRIALPSRQRRHKSAFNGLF
jgi:hypothetical protein